MSARAEIISTLPPHITLCAVSKQQPVAAIESLIAEGQLCFGENRVQEAAEKFPALKAKHPNIKLHLIGPLQTNKVKAALELFDVIETLDRPELAEAIAKHPTDKKDFFIQVNTGNEPQKSGVSPKDFPNLLSICQDLKLRITGLMCIPPINQHPAPHFAFLYELARRHNLNRLSMGMSADYQTAIQLGSTEIRLGTALFGPRTAT
jgi:pyridoxal phosphate enzyme (YggS family)